MSQRYIGGLIYNPPGGYSGYFNGSSSLSISSSNTVLPTGTQDFCVEMWFSWQTQSGSYPQLIANPTTNGFQIYYDVASGLFAVGIFNVSNVITYTISQTALSGGWNHLAVTRSGNTFRLFLNGILQANGTNTISFASVTTQYIGSDGSRPYTGYLSNVRTVLGAIPTPYQTSSTTNGTAVFTPPNGALQAITSTALLTCAFATFRDGSTNNYTITVNSATVSTQNPFPLTTLPNPAQGNAGNGIFSMSQYQSLKQQNLWPAIDPYFDYTTLLLHGNGTNGAQNNTFLDSSTNNFTITRNGNTTQGTFTPYGSNWSNYFTASSGDCLVNTSSALASTTASTFTAEAWVFLTATPSNASFPSMGTVITLDGAKASANIYMSFGVTTSNTISLYWYDGSSKACIGSTALTLNQWTHIAASVNSNTIKLFVNGVSETLSGTTTLTNRASATNTFAVGGNYYSTTPAYISNARVTNTAVYTSNFTPSTTPLTAISGTQLLTCQSNRFIDNSSNAFTITRNGDVRVQRFSPFNPSAPYAAGTIGGSGYFDGSGDYLSVADNAAFDFGSGDFTIECWAYTDTFASQYNVLVCQWNTSYSFIFRITSSLVGLYINVGNPYTLQDYSASVTNTTGQWNHFCVTRSGSTLTFYKNGSSIGTSSISATITNAASDLTVGVLGDLNSTTYHKGYISGMRLIKGTAVAPTITTPPTAVSGTSLLLNFTNGGIIDNAMMNDLETVGNAQISTTQSKFGGASIYNSGTGNYPRAPWSPNLELGSGSFTIEFWVYPISSSSLLCWSTDWHYGIVWNYGGASSNKIGVWASSNGSSWDIWNADPGGNGISSSSVSANTWSHIAWVRNGSSWALYINGTSSWTGTSSATIVSRSTDTLRIAGDWPNSGPGGFNGYIDDFRITKGYARYTANFTPQTSQWQDQ